MFRDTLKEVLNDRWPGHLWDVSAPPDASLGDYSVNLAFALAKTVRRPVLDAAQEVADAISGSRTLEVMVERAQVVAPGFVNIFLKDSYLQGELERTAHAGDAFGSSPMGRGKKVIVEYSSPNIAKPMHVGHLRSTIIGDALANIYAMLGHEVIRWNYIGDWGTQFGKLIAAYKRWGSPEELNKNPIGALESLYVRFHAEMDGDPSLEKQGQEEFRKLEEGDAENRDLWVRFRELSLGEFGRMYERLGVTLGHGDNPTVVVKGESDYEDELKPLIGELTGNGIAAAGEGGALVVDLSAFDIATPGMIRKSDGATLYLTRDVASLRDRIAEHRPYRALYVVANQQSLHFEQLFAIAELMKQKGLIADDLPEMVHVKFGLVLGKDGRKFSTRQGNAVPLQDVLDEATRRASAVVRAKNPDLPDDRAGDVAHQVGLAALKYNDLRQHPHSDITFDWDSMLDLSGNSGPYLQYTHARLASIISKSAHSSLDIRHLSLLVLPDERALMRRLLDFPTVVADCARLAALNGLALYLYELAALSNRYYEHTRILDDDDAERVGARLALISTIVGVIRRGLGLLGIQAPERI